VCFLAFREVAEMAEPNRNRQTAMPGLRRTYSVIAAGLINQPAWTFWRD
jgi:hypothetical protein